MAKSLKQQSVDLTPLVKRVDVMIASVKHTLAELRDNPDKHLHLCECRRMQTRFNKCAACVADETKNAQGVSA